MNRRYYDTSVDYFAVLGVHYGACDNTVKRMYRKMARRYHPDVSMIHDAQKKFQEIAFAYEVLKKHRKEYCLDYERDSARKFSSQSVRSGKRGANAGAKTYARYQKTTKRYFDQAYHSHQPIDGKNRIITYPITLRYAIRLLTLGYFYISGLKVKMKFTREAFNGKTFRLKGKGYNGLFGGKSGDYLVCFTIKIDCAKFRLEGGDVYGVFSIPKLLIKGGKKLELETPAGKLSVIIPENYTSQAFIQVKSMGLPSDGVFNAGDFYVRLIPS